MTAALSEIDPAFDTMTEFSRHASGTVEQIHGMRQKAIFTDGELPAKTKALGAVLWAVSAKCEPCIRYYVQQAKERGVSKEEIGEMLGVASTMGGCVGEMWALKAFHAFVGGTPADGSDPSCCATD